MVNFTPPTLASETIGMIGSMELRNTLVMSWLAMAVLSIGALLLAMTRYRQIPGRFQALAETIVEGLFDFFTSITQSPEKTRKAFPLVATIFLFIITGNWMGILPGVGSITIQGMHAGHLMNIPVLRSMNADVNMTLAIAIISVILTQVIGLTTIGILPHIRKYAVAPWRKPYLIGTFVGVLEFVGEFGRLVSFTFRLFGNIFAGEVLLVLIAAFVPFLAPVPFLGLEIFVGFIQALVFSVLTLVFMNLATVAHGEHEEHA
jgi:F-type H+-transporting ATPase subunit a